MVQPNNHFYLILLLLPHYYGTDTQSPIPAPTTHDKMWDPSMAIIIISLIGIFFSVRLFSLFLSRFVPSHFSPCSSQRGIHPQLLHTFPTLFFSSINHLRLTKGTLECSVCLNDFTDNDMLRLLPHCNHVFHPPCIDQWLSSHLTCPLCRADLTQDFHQVPILVPTQISVNETCIELEASRSGEREIEEARGKGDEGGADASKLKVLKRANSTGHSVVESGECMERYTLRLPEEVRKYILLNHGVMQRSNSYNVVMPRRGGLCWSDSEGSSGKSSKRNNIGTRL